MKNLVNLIDPYKNGQLNYQQFLNGIAQMTQLNNDNTIASQDIKKHVNNKTNHNKYDEVDRNSNGVSDLLTKKSIKINILAIKHFIFTSQQLHLQTIHLTNTTR